MSDLYDRIIRCLADWPYDRQGPPNTWGIARGIGAPPGKVADALDILENESTVVTCGKDAIGARLWRLSLLGQANRS